MRSKTIVFVYCIFMAACGGKSDQSSSIEETIKVYKSNGADMCGYRQGIELEVMHAELVEAGIDVICAQEGFDGGKLCESCGCYTGEINIFEIHPQNEENALNAAYHLIEELENYVDADCS